MTTAKYMGFDIPDVNGNNNAWGGILNTGLAALDQMAALKTGGGINTINTTTWRRLGSDIPLNGNAIQMYGSSDRALVLPNQATASGNEVFPLGTIIEVLSVQWNGVALIECEGWQSNGSGPMMNYSLNGDEKKNQQRVWLARAAWLRLMYTEHPGKWRVMGNGIRDSAGW